MTQQPSRLYQMIEDRLEGQTLAEYVAQNKVHKTWRELAADLNEKTSAGVSHETLRLWFARRIQTTIRVA